MLSISIHLCGGYVRVDFLVGRVFDGALMVVVGMMVVVAVVRL